MRGAALAFTLICSLLGVAWAQVLELRTAHGPLLANADRVLLSADDGRWREVSGEGGAYDVELPGARYSLAITCFGHEGPHVTVYRFLAGELKSLLHACPGRGDVLSPPARLRGELRLGARAPGPDVISVHLGARTLMRGEARDRTAFSLAVADALEADLLALLGEPGEAPTEAVLHRAADLTGPGAITFDFSGEDAARLERYTLSAEPADGALLTAQLSTCGGTQADVGGGAATEATEATELHYAALPAERRRECDRYELTAHWSDPGERSGASASVILVEPADVILQRPPPAASPAIDTVGTDPLRARLTWPAEAGALYYAGGFTDGRVTWNFVQSASLPPAITLPPWGADVGVPELRGGDFSWSFGVVHGIATVQETLLAIGRTNWPQAPGEWWPAPGGAAYQVQYTGGKWAPHASESSGSR